MIKIHFFMITKAIKERFILQNLPVTPDWLSEKDLQRKDAKPNQSEQIKSKRTNQIKANKSNQSEQIQSKRTNRIKANKSNQSQQIESKPTNRIKANKSKTSHHNCSKQYDKLSKQKKKPLWMLNLQDLIFVFHFNDFLLL